jgi:chromosome segregation ATPase
MEDNTFIEHVNSTPRKLGHNKLQTQIDILENDIAKLRLADTEKETKLGLFKKSISSLQQQLQEKANHISNIDEMKRQNDDETVIQSLKDALAEESIKLSTITNNLITLNEIAKQKDIQIENLQNASIVSADKYQLLLDDYIILKTEFDTQTRTLGLNETQTNLLKQSLQQTTNISEAVHNELQSLRDELTACKLALQNKEYEHNETETQLHQQLERVEPNHMFEKDGINVDTERNTERVVGQPRRKMTRGIPKKRR